MDFYTFSIIFEPGCGLVSIGYNIALEVWSKDLFSAKKDFFILLCLQRKMLQDKSISYGFREQVWLLQTIQQKMWSKFETYFVPFSLKTYAQCSAQ